MKNYQYQSNYAIKSSEGNVSPYNNKNALTKKISLFLLKYVLFLLFVTWLPVVEAGKHKKKNPGPATLSPEILSAITAAVTAAVSAALPKSSKQSSSSSSSSSSNKNDGDMQDDSRADELGSDKDEKKEKKVDPSACTMCASGNFVCFPSLKNESSTMCAACIGRTVEYSLSFDPNVKYMTYSIAVDKTVKGFSTLKIDHSQCDLAILELEKKIAEDDKKDVKRSQSLSRRINLLKRAKQHKRWSIENNILETVVDVACNNERQLVLARANLACCGVIPLLRWEQSRCFLHEGRGNCFSRDFASSIVSGEKAKASPKGLDQKRAAEFNKTFGFPPPPEIAVYLQTNEFVKEDVVNKYPTHFVKSANGYKKAVKKYCDKHGENLTHRTDECNVLKKEKEEKKKKKQEASPPPKKEKKKKDATPPPSRSRSRQPRSEKKEDDNDLTVPQGGQLIKTLLTKLSLRTDTRVPLKWVTKNRAAIREILGKGPTSSVFKALKMAVYNGNTANFQFRTPPECEMDF